MSIHAPRKTLDALGNGLLPECNSRSLFKDRFADPEAKDDKDATTRKDWFRALIGRSAVSIERLEWHPDGSILLHARLASRLMIDLAGGVMENANLNLDRYGLPVIPGSAVKGCARRMALQALHDWIEHQESKGSAERPTPDDACAPCCEGFEKPAEMLSAIARVFGWTPEDWKTDKNSKEHYKSDFAWACAGNKELLQAAKSLNPDFDTFAGTIAFLPATPNCDPHLELDVVTPPHTQYHSREPGYENAPDTEDPIPVFFPAVKPQGENDYFTFPLIPLRRAITGDIDLAKRWLAHGLELLGIGAKTCTGYGVFSVLDDENQPAYPARFEPILSESEKFLRDWGNKILNSMSTRVFVITASTIQSDTELLRVFKALAADKLSNLKDPFWNPLKIDPKGKSLLTRITPLLPQP